jgi:FkbH-like protein
MPLEDRIIAIAATFTAEAIQPGLAFWADLLGFPHEIRFAHYNQIFQQLLDPSSLFASNRSGFNVALLRLEDWLQAGVSTQVNRFLEAVRSRTGAPLIVVLCPATPEQAAALAPVERDLAASLAGMPAVYPVSAAEVDALYPVGEVHDPHGNELGHVPYTPLYFVALATAIARKIHALSVPPYKVAAVDCDNTLWSGICGEDGPAGVTVDPPRMALQQFLAERRREGLLLALCSKNNEEDVIETFRVHPEMPLRLEDFAARRINWQSKGVNLAELAEELDLALDSFLLLDDSPKECKEAEIEAPGILGLPLPSNPAEIPDFLKHVWALDRARVTEEDRRRAELYAQRAERIRAERSAANLEEFLAALDLQVTITPAAAEQVPRIAQLTNRTNQMNTTLVRQTESELLSADAELLAVEVSDRFGSYGLCGAIVFRCEAEALIVDAFLLSCRALGRGVEHRMLAHLGRTALAHGLRRVEVPFVEGPRNRPAALFLESLGKPRPDGVFVFAAEEAAAIEYKPSAVVTSSSHEPSDAQALPGGRHRVPYFKIATSLRRPEAILEQIRARSRSSIPARAAADPPRTPLERDLAALWADLLNLPAVGVHDNFFDLGGHSLLAVQLLSRVRQMCGVELSLELVYSGEFTVAELAKAVELKEIEQAGGDYQDLLAELEGLSDEEARELLAKEQGAE